MSYADPYAPLPSQGHVAPREMDLWAVLGLVFSVLFWPAGLVMSIVGITRTGPNGHSGRGVAVAGVVVSIMAALLTASAVVGGIAVALVADQNKELFVASSSEDAFVPADDGTGPSTGKEAAETEFQELTPLGWAAFLEDPEALRGTSVVFYLDVSQVMTYEDADDEIFGYAGPERPLAQSQLEDHLTIWMAEGASAQFEEGDFLRVEGVIYGTMDYETVRGKTKTIPLIDAVTIRKMD